MTPERKKAQDKLRRKYGYSTNDNYGRGTILYKAFDKGYTHKDGYKVVSDINICMDNRIVWSYGDKNTIAPIEIETTEYKDNGQDAPKDKRYMKIGRSIMYLSLEELDLIHAIAHQMAEENDWDGQIKDYNKNRRKK